ncbi:hypothetical protein KM043_018248 [Ampulex compressa]|nr:hypothetical protein KM043_018248 [Ampulex compressa]
MSIPFSGTRTRSKGIISAIAKQLRILNLKPVKRVVVQFDPFHEQAKETRDFLFHISGAKIAATNPNCIIKTNILCDRSEPTITFNLESGDKVLVKSTNLSSLNILEIYNKHVTSLIPPSPEEIAEQQKILEEKVKKQNKRRKRNRPKRESKRRGVELLG